VLVGYLEQIHSLLEVQTNVIKDLIDLQEGWVNNVEDDLATRDELDHFKKKFKAFSDAAKENHETSDSKLLFSQLSDAASNIGPALETFT
jgi:hypothetical protein